jgi:2-isopropylmalate synthase
MQAPSVQFDAAQSAEIVTRLVDVGVDVIECGHPAASLADFDKVRAVVAAAGRTPVLAHARALPTDIDVVARTGARAVGIFLGVSELSRKCRVRRSLPELLNLIIGSVSHARKRGLDVRFTVEDASRTSATDLFQAYEAAVTAGAARICFADTVGIMTPSNVRAAIVALRAAFPSAAIEGHFHDDRGFALANAFAAIESGATWISSSTNGLGERCGITDTVRLLANLAFDGHRSFPKPGRLESLSRVVAAFARVPVPRHAPVVGQDAFRQTAALHRRAVALDERAYTWLDPSILGARQTISSSRLPTEPIHFVVRPRAIPSCERNYHCDDASRQYVMIDERFIPECRQYCVVRTIPPGTESDPCHTDLHRHDCDSLFIVLGINPELSGFRVEVRFGDENIELESPASIFVPAGVVHSYRILSGPGLLFHHVLSGCHENSLLPSELSR